MARFPFRAEVSSGEAGGPRRTFVRDELTFDPSVSRLSVDELDRRRFEAESRRAALGSWVDPLWRGVQSAASATVVPVLAGYEVLRNEAAAYEGRGIRGAEAADLGLGAVRLPPEGESVVGEENWSSVGQVLNDWRDNPGSMTLQRVAPGLLGLIGDFVMPGGFDFLRAGQLAEAVAQGAELALSTLSKWDKFIPGLTAFLLPLREALPAGADTTAIVERIDEVAEQEITDPAQLEAFRNDLRDFLFRGYETQARGLYGGSDLTGGSQNKIAFDLNVSEAISDVDRGLFRSEVDPVTGVTVQSGRQGVYNRLSDPQFAQDAGIANYPLRISDILSMAARAYGIPSDRPHFIGTSLTRAFDIRPVIGNDVDAEKSLTAYTAASPSRLKAIGMSREATNAMTLNGIPYYYNAVNQALRKYASSGVLDDAIRDVQRPAGSTSARSMRPGTSRAVQATIDAERTTGGNWLPSVKDWELLAREISNLDRVFDRASTPVATTLHRGVFYQTQYNPFQFNVQELVDEAVASGNPEAYLQQVAAGFIGREVYDPAFSSFSEDPTRAYSFIRGKSVDTPESEMDSVGVLYQMKAPAGSPIIPLYAFGDVNNTGTPSPHMGYGPFEQEVLIPRNTGFRVVNAQFRYPEDVGQVGQVKPDGRNSGPVTANMQLKPYLIVQVEPIWGNRP